MRSSYGLIVIADDDDDVRDILAGKFERAGYEVETAAHGADMLDLLQSVEHPVAIFVDLVMPGVLGSSIVEFIRSEPRWADVPVGVVTGSPELAPPGVKVFTKPARFDALLAFVRARHDHSSATKRSSHMTR